MSTLENISQGPSRPLVNDVADWLMEAALGLTTADKLLEQCSLRLNAAGIPLWRSNIGFPILHPLYTGVAVTWYRDEGLEPVQTFEEMGGTAGDEVWENSPANYIIKNDLPFLRRRLTGPDAQLDFPVLEEFRDKGATDYLVWIVEFQGAQYVDAGNDGMVGSWATDRPGGFSDEDILALMRIQQRLAVACKMTIREQITRNVLRAYLGPEAGQKVLEGRIALGDSEKIYSVIWFADLRDSTRLADELAPDDFLKLVNEYFDCTAGAVIANGGEVLRFVGDAVLAIFPFTDERSGDAETCAKALSAAADAEQRLEVLNKARTADGKDPIDFGIGLHVGELMYGNIGVAERVEFSVIGPAANEAARLEDLTKRLGHRVIVSDAFANISGGDVLSLGAHDLRGVGEPMEVYTPTLNASTKKAAAE